MAYDLKDIILNVNNNNSAAIGEILDKSWKLKKVYHQKLQNKFIDNCYEKALNCGAYGGKVAGAGRWFFDICGRKV